MSDGMRPIRIPRCTVENNIKTDLTEADYADMNRTEIVYTGYIPFLQEIRNEIAQDKSHGFLTRHFVFRWVK
jgi:hypothetical protein